MLNSRNIKFLACVCFLLVIVGCVTTDNKTTTESQVEGEDNRVLNANTVIPEKDSVTPNKVLVDLSLIDPMKSVTLPLPLIKGYDEVSSLMAQKSYSLAINKLKMLQDSHPNYSGPSYQLALVYQQQKDLDTALVAINSAIKINPLNYYAFNLKGLLLREKGAFDASLEAYLQAIKIYPNYADSQLNIAILADIYLYDLELALMHYERYLQLIAQAETTPLNPKNDEKKVSGWIADLKRRIAKG